MVSFEKLGAPPAHLKRSRASLVGGVACGIGAFILCLLLAGGPGLVSVVVGLAIGGALACWVRLADL